MTWSSCYRVTSPRAGEDGLVSQYREPCQLPGQAYQFHHGDVAPFRCHAVLEVELDPRQTLYLRAFDALVESSEALGPG
jgi:hypothetical protein